MKRPKPSSIIHERMSKKELNDIYEKDKKNVKIQKTGESLIGNMERLFMDMVTNFCVENGLNSAILMMNPSIDENNNKVGFTFHFTSNQNAIYCNEYPHINPLF